MFKGKEKNDFSNILLQNLIFIKKLGDLIKNILKCNFVKDLANSVLFF